MSMRMRRDAAEERMEAVDAAGREPNGWMDAVTVAARVLFVPLFVAVMLLDPLTVPPPLVWACFVLFVGAGSVVLLPAVLDAAERAGILDADDEERQGKEG